MNTGIRTAAASVFAATLLFAAAAPAPAASSLNTLTISPSSPAIGDAVLVEGGSCDPGERVRLGLGYAPAFGSVIGTDVTADDSGRFVAALPMFAHTAVPTGTEFRVRAECGGPGQTDPDRFEEVTGTVGASTAYNLAVQLSPDPINPGGHLTVLGVGCAPAEPVTFATDDPAITDVVRASNEYGRLYGVLITDPAAAPGSTLEVTVTCGSTTPPVDPERVWTGSVTYTGTVAEPPLAIGDEVTTTEDTTVTIRPLENDRGGEALITYVGSPGHGSAVLSDDGTSIDYTPAPGFVGTDEFSYGIENSDGGSGAEIMVTVRPAAEPPPEDDGDEDGSGEDGSGEDGSGEDGSGEDGSGEDGSGEDGSGEDGSGEDGSGEGGTGDTDSDDQNDESGGGGDKGDDDPGAGADKPSAELPDTGLPSTLITSAVLLVSLLVVFGAGGLAAARYARARS